MAFDKLIHDIGAEHFPGASAGENLSGGQYKAVQLVGSTVLYAVTVTSGMVCVLYNAPTSGQPVQAYGAPHTVKAVAAGTIPGGAWVSLTGSSAFEQGSSGNAVGIALNSAVTNDVFALRLK